MTKVARKDYGSAAIVDPSMETVKRVNSMNTPFGVQQTGALKADVDIPAKDINYANFKAGTRVLRGNKEGYVKATTFTGVDPNQVLESATFGFIKDGSEYTEGPYTVAEIKAMGNVFFAVSQ